MELKRILAKDIRRATEKAVALYGQDVLFVSNSRVNGMTEVIVAVDVAPEPWMEAADKGDGETFGQALHQSMKSLNKGDMTSSDEDADTDADAARRSTHCVTARQSLMVRSSPNACSASG